ncbi:MAG TPA: glycosyl transferase [Algoriphagus sp.]|jgi:glycosyltransferase involved in cell wall biosynthesis|uniref:glycosyltransferase n=3 Tax=Algoriphagus TaxID=246875 RepID=UPI000C69FCA0|nr:MULTISPECIES: glycosyltransferase [unclassified Algoriphagus]MAL15957.1 glycosyl transferase [Algoriphagus sp.]MAN89021.1 glycosyl transferase [Algoriphagus sp.]QYH40578.1 glycosyltransferase family 1 protein [Algoriphagus sp. NBT04N3]HAZ23310.1 glycosyl transferase [Algoriphagus sp.]HCB45963.1 glycosyl transferase [Algoriphagus sp.]|tara:strand:- start:564 stop:1688 length:1125 start_codon:yes stop_codon:yes gene_type:complete
MAASEQKLKVAIMGAKGYPYVYGGYDTMIKELGERLVKKGVHVRVYNHRALFPKRPRFVNGIECIYTPAIESKSLTQLTHTFFSMLHACFSDVDVILVVNSGNGPFGIISKVFRKPTAINVDGLEWLRPKWKGFGSKYFYWASKMATRFYDQIINDSDEMRRVYLELFNKDSKVIAYGANPKESVSQSYLEKWKLESRTYFLIVGRLVPDNNADLIIEGFLKSDSSKKLVIVGDVPFSDEWATQLKNIQDPRLLFTGYVTDPNELAALYSHCFGYFHGHEFGGTNPAMLKALGYGCAILALNTPFNQEMLQNGKHGWYFEKNAESVRRIVAKAESESEKMESLRKTAKDGLIQKYNWDYVTEQYLEVFRELARK